MTKIHNRDHAEIEATLMKAAVEDDDAVISAAKMLFFDALSNRDDGRARAVSDTLIRFLLPKRTGRAWSAYFRAVLASVQQRWDQAERHALQALRLADDVELRGRACNELGILYDHLGRWQDAIGFYQTGLAAFAVAGDAEYTAKLNKNLGTALVRGVEVGVFAAERLHEAEDRIRQALDHFAGYGPPRLEASAWNELGTVYKAQSRWGDAAACYEYYRVYFADRGEAMGQGQALNNRGEVLRLTGRLAEAEANFLAALDLTSGDIWEEIDVLINLAHTQADLGRDREAALTTDRALARVESLRARLQTASTRTDFFAVQQRSYAWRAHLAFKSKQLDQVFSLSERAKSRTFGDLLAGQRLQPHGDVPLRWQREETNLRRRLDDLLAHPLAESDRRAELVATIEARWLELRQRIAHRDAEFGSLGFAAPLTAEAVQARLPSYAALLSYFESEGELLAILVQPDSIRVFPLGVSLAAIGEASFDAKGRPRGLLAQGDRLGRPWVLGQLGRVLLGPLTAHLEEIDHVCIVPQGVLHHLPFAALRLDESGRALREIVGAVSQAPSATVWLDYCQSRTVAPADAMVLGFDGKTLTHAEAEAHAIGKLLGVDALMGIAATRPALASRGSSARLLHLACPGLYRPDQPLRSGIHLADGFLDVTATCRRLRLQAELVTLSGCETGLGYIQSGDEIAGLVRAWLYAGAAGVLVSLWTVNDLSTRLLMQEFYPRLAEVGPARALILAQVTLATMATRPLTERLLGEGISALEIESYLGQLSRLWDSLDPDHPLAHPYFWAGFVLQGGRFAGSGSPLGGV